jgi:uncharacterized membrane protein
MTLIQAMARQVLSIHSFPASCDNLSEMKFGDVGKIYEAGLITDEQREKIIGHFGLKEEGGKFLAIISIVGAVLVAAGITLLIAAHWNEIPRGGKIAAGILLMLGAHAGGWWLREIRGTYRKTGEALHLIGSCQFLANIALIGQIYNIVTRAPDAFLIWWLGIVAMPWLLRSRAQFVLLLVAFSVWFGFEVNERGSWVYCESERQILLYALLGLVFLGAGYCLRVTNFFEFAEVAEKFGLVLFLIFFFPLTWKGFFGWENNEMQEWIFPVLGTVVILLLVIGIKNLRALTKQWRWTWFAALSGMAGFMACVWFGLWQVYQAGGGQYGCWEDSWGYLAATLALFVFCLLQIQAGIQERSPFLVNAGVVFIAVDIIAAYFDLFGSMARTGVMFLISGIFLIVFGIYLEKKRRGLMRRMKTTMAKEAQ